MLGIVLVNVGSEFEFVSTMFQYWMITASALSYSFHLYPRTVNFLCVTSKHVRRTCNFCTFDVSFVVFDAFFPCKTWIYMSLQVL